MHPEIVSREEWLAARKALLAEEREATHLRDRVNAARRALPWVKIDTDYVFQSLRGPMSLGDLFQGRSQLLVQHFMLAPGSDHICPGCAAMADHVDVARRHFEHVRARLGWTFLWVSSAGTNFNYDFGASFTPEQIAGGAPVYNYGTSPLTAEDMPANSIFARNEAGEVFHTYSAYARGNDSLFVPFNFLDLAPKGRNEADGVMSWVRLHDEYDREPAGGTCC